MAKTSRERDERLLAKAQTRLAKLERRQRELERAARESRGRSGTTAAERLALVVDEIADVRRELAMISERLDNGGNDGIIDAGSSDMTREALIAAGKMTPFQRNGDGASVQLLDNRPVHAVFNTVAAQALIEDGGGDDDETDDGDGVILHDDSIGDDDVDEDVARKAQSSSSRRRPTNTSRAATTSSSSKRRRRDELSVEENDSDSTEDETTIHRSASSYVDDADDRNYFARLRRYLARHRPDMGDVNELQDEDIVTLVTETVMMASNSAGATTADDADAFFDAAHQFRLPGVLYSRLFEYQRIGVKWLCELYAQNVGGILGDEMGLGRNESE